MVSKLAAGEFSEWLAGFIQGMKGHGEGRVPCGNCVACCTSSKFILVRPTDQASLECIPRKLLFPAPGLARGHYLLGYDGKGCCPMFKEGRCSIYASRPETCRQYDCRALAVLPGNIDEGNIEITNKIRSWEFDFEKPESAALFKAVNLAYVFLTEFGDSFPSGFVPAANAMKAIFALRIHGEFVGLTEGALFENRKALVERIVATYGIREGHAH